MYRYASLIVAACLIFVVVGVPLAGASTQWPFSVTLPVVLKQADPSAPTATPSPTPTTGAGLGSLRFTTDPARRQSVAMPGEGENATLMLTDAAGLVWTLAIHGDSFLAGQTIAMTAFSSVDASAALASVSSGVLLEPDGLQFAKPLTLTVTAPDNWTGLGLLFHAGADGSGLDFAATRTSGRTHSTTLWHFSSVGAADVADAQISRLVGRALDQYNAARVPALALLDPNNPRPTPPAPPAPSMLCYGTSAWDDAQQSKKSAVDDYVREFIAPYANISRQVLAYGLSAEMLGNDLAGEPADLAGRLGTMAAEAARDQLNAHRSNPDAFLATGRAAMAVARQAEMFGGAGLSTILPAYIAAAESARDKYLDKLLREHRYTAFPPVLMFEASAEAVGGGYDDGNIIFRSRDLSMLRASGLAENFLQKMAAAMTFEITIDNVADLVADHAKYVQHGDSITLPMNPLPTSREAQIGDPKAFRWDVQGTVDYTFGRYWGEDAELHLRLPLSYSTWMRILRFDPCVKKALDFDVDKWGAASEPFIAGDAVVHFGGPGQPAGADAFFTMYWWADERQTENGFWRFEMPIEDGNEKMSDQTFRKTIVAPQYVETRQQLKHKPGRVSAGG